MADGYIQLPADSSGKKLDAELLTVGANSVYRERMQLAGASALQIAAVQATAPAGTEYGLVTRPIPSGTQPVSAASLPLPSGAATSAAQSTGNVSLASIDGKLPALGQALAAASVPVVLTALQITALTPLATVAATQSGSWSVSITGAVTLPTGAATSANQATEIASLASIDGKLPALGQALAAASVPVVLTASQITTLTPLSTITAVTSITNVVHVDDNSSTLSVDDGGGSLTVDGSVSITANSTVDVSRVGGTAIDTNSGNKSAGTIRVVIATDQVQLTNALKVDGSAVTQPISAASLPLPSGASTAAKQPALGTAGAASADVISIQGIASMTALSVKAQPDATATYAPSGSDSAAYVASQVVKASPGVLFSITGYNSRTTPQFIQVHNTTSAPADTAVPVVIFRAEALSNFFWSPGEKFGKYFSTGITVCNSSTGPTKTIGSADCWINAQYV